MRKEEKEEKEERLYRHVFLEVGEDLLHHQRL
jgi:hypothetical protein